MARKRKPAFEPSGFFAWRTPLLPFDELRGWSDDLQAPAARGDTERLAEALDADRQVLRQRLAAIIARPEVRDALFVASPDLDESLDLWLREPGSKRGQKVERALVRYFVRMAGRATPFGLFSGCSVGTLADTTDLVLGPRQEYLRHTRLDMDYLCALTDALAADAEIRNGLPLRPNSSLYRSGEHLRYVESSLEPTTRVREHTLSAVEATDYLEVTLERALDGALPDELAAALAGDDPEVSEEEARAYVDELVDNQILLPELQPVVTGTEAIDDLLERTQGHPHVGQVHCVLDETRASLREVDRCGAGADPEAYLQVARRLEELPAKVHLPRLFQVDMIKPSPVATLGRGILREVEQGLELLHRLAATSSDTALSRFRADFMARYEGQELPLVQVLDEELGIGYERSDHPSAEASPLLEGMLFAGRQQDSRVRWGPRETWLLRLLGRAIHDRAPELVLTAKDLDRLAADEPLPLPDAFAVLAQVVAPSVEAIAEGNYRLLLGGASGPSGAVLLGRFCHADPLLTGHVTEHLRAEEALRPDALFAEIVHLPEGRIGNILFRPVLRDHEIPFLGRSGASPERQIPITDLWVSVVGDRIVLRSRRLDREVIPRLTSAHNYSWRSLGIYRFLCTLQAQGTVGGSGWSWGPLANAPFLPRVVHGHLVLARASWNLRQPELEALGKVKGAELFEAVQQLRDRLGWPRWIVVADADNELPVDLDNGLCVETFAHLVKGRSWATVAELYPGPDELCARGPEGRFTHELVIPYVRCREPSPATEVIAAPTARRSFPPNSVWLYGKLYTGTATADRVLCEAVRPLVDDVLAANLVDRWFFIRYGDPEWHLRLRLHGEPRALQAEVLPRLERAAAPLMASSQVWRLQLDTYERELERYGATEEAMDLAEQLFWIDSEAVLSIVESLGGDEGLDARWRLALYGIHLLLVDLGLDLPTRLTLMKGTRDAFGAQFMLDVELMRQIGSRFRAERDALMALIQGELDQDEALAPGVAALRRRSQQLAPVVARLRATEQARRTHLSVGAMAGSFVHMHANRLLRSAARAQELVLYDFLGRLYASQKAQRQ